VSYTIRAENLELKKEIESLKEELKKVKDELEYYKYYADDYVAFEYKFISENNIEYRK